MIKNIVILDTHLLLGLLGFRNISESNGRVFRLANFGKSTVVQTKIAKWPPKAIPPRAASCSSTAISTGLDARQSKMQRSRWIILATINDDVDEAAN